MRAEQGKLPPVSQQLPVPPQSLGRTSPGGHLGGQARRRARPCAPFPVAAAGFSYLLFSPAVSGDRHSGKFRACLQDAVGPGLAVGTACQGLMPGPQPRRGAAPAGVTAQPPGAWGARSVPLVFVGTAGRIVVTAVSDRGPALGGCGHHSWHWVCPKAPLSACTCRALCGYLAGQAWRLGGHGGLQAPADALWSLGPHPACLGSPQESQDHSPRETDGQRGPAHTGVGGSQPLGCGGRAESAGGRGGRRPQGQTAGLRWMHILSHLRLQIPRRVRLSPWLGRSHLEKREVCGEQAAWPGLAPCQHFGGRVRDVGGRVPGPRAEVADRRPQAQGETDIAPGSGVQTPPPRRPTAVGVRCAAAGQPLSVSGPFPCLLDGGWFQQGRLLGAILRGSPSAPRGQ